MQIEVSLARISYQFQVCILAPFFLKRTRILFLICNRTSVSQVGTLGPGSISPNPLPGILGEPLHKPEAPYEGLRQKTGVVTRFKTRLFLRVEAGSGKLPGALAALLMPVAPASGAWQVPHRRLPVFTEGAKEGGNENAQGLARRAHLPLLARLHLPLLHVMAGLGAPDTSHLRTAIIPSVTVVSTGSWVNAGTTSKRERTVRYSVCCPSDALRPACWGGPYALLWD